MSKPVARSCVCGANRRLFNTALEFIKLVYQDSGSRAGRTRRVVAPEVDLLRLPVAHQMCIPDLWPGPVAGTCGWELTVWITVASATALVDEVGLLLLMPAAHCDLVPLAHDSEHMSCARPASCASSSPLPPGCSALVANGFADSEFRRKQARDYQAGTARTERTRENQEGTRRKPRENQSEAKKEPGENQREPMKSRKR